MTKKLQHLPNQEACRDAEREQAPADLQRRYRARRLHLFLKAVGRRYLRARLDNYTITSNAQEDVVNALYEYASNMPAEVQAGNPIVLFGPTGTGKDHLLVGLSVIAITQFDMDVEWRNALDVFRDCREAIRSEESELKICRRLTEPRILFFSDPVRPRVEANPQSTGALTEYQAEVLSGVIDRRNRDCKPTWITLNVESGGEAERRLSAPLVSRLKEDGLVCWCNWPCHRKARYVGGLPTKAQP